MLRRAHILLLLFLQLLASVSAQEPVAPVTGWLATVDEASQLIVLSWHPSADTAAMGYHICTGSPCLDYDTVFGRLDTTYVCLNHSPLESHTYRIHVFDSAYNVSSLTEPFGNMVLHADVPECEDEVAIAWTPYQGMPGGVTGYRLMMLLEPFDTSYRYICQVGPDGPFSYNYELPYSVTRVHIKVQALGNTLVSQSNIVSVDRLTIDTAAFVEISQVVFDSLSGTVQLDFNIDTSYHSADHYTLWRSIDYSPWRILAEGTWDQYTDNDINLYDSLYCYQLSVYDACRLNEKFSATACTVVPDPPEPGIALPNVVIAGDETNGTFLPAIVGLAGDLYEFTVYNRWGMQIFATSDPSEGWHPSPSTPQGAYAYVLRVRYADGVIQSYVGTILVIK